MSSPLAHDPPMKRRNFFALLGGLAAAVVAAPGFRSGEKRGRSGLILPGDFEEDPYDCSGGAWEWWQDLPRTILTESDDPVVARLILAAERRTKLRVSYRGGSEPCITRTISPVGVFTVEGCAGVYVAAYCHRRRAARTFRVDRIAAVA